MNQINFPSKIRFLRLTLAIQFILFVSSCQKPKSPNIIFILTDDQRWDALGYAGNDQIHTPEMDKLAEEGTYFKNAFVTTPICAASRASIFTGLYERTHGYTFEQGEIKEKFIQNSYPVLLREAGYHTGFYGKFGVEYSKVNQLFDKVESYDRDVSLPDRRGYYFKMLDGDSVHLTRYTGQKAIDFIKDVPEDAPFCLSLSFSAPHAHDPAELQYFWQEEVDYLYNDFDFDPPVLSEEKYFMEQPEYVRKGLNRVRWYWRYDTPEKYQHSRKGYNRMISGIDLEIQKIREALKEKGIDKNTIIILMGDNGHFFGERQLAGKWLMYDNSLRVPLIIMDPRENNHHEIEKMVLNLDVPSTILDYAGVEIPEKWQGISLANIKASEKISRDIFLCEHLWDFEHIPPSEGIRTEEWKYFRYRIHPEHEELYNLKDDPLEIYNLAKDSIHRDILKEYRSRCDQLIEKIEIQK